MKYHIGVCFDKWTPAVEAALFRDLVGLQDKTELIVICDSAEPDRMLAGLGITRLSLHSLANVWILYQVEQPVAAPRHDVQTITRNFIVEKKESRMRLEPRSPVTLPEQGRENHYRPFSQPPPANTGGIPLDPRVALLFT